MSQRQFYQFLFSGNPKLTLLEGSFMVGASGAVKPTSGVLGVGIQGVQKLGTGQYQIQLGDNYNRFLDFQGVVLSPTSAGTAITDGSFTVGKPYQILFPSTSTNWSQLMSTTGLTPQVGMPFVASTGATAGPLGSSGVTAAGNGTAIPIIVSGVSSVEVLGNPNLTLGPSTPGGYVYIQTLDKNNAAVSPTSGSVVRFNLMMRNSSLLLTNETTGPYNY